MSPHDQVGHPTSKIDNPMVKLSYPTSNHNHPTMMILMMADDPLSGSKERKREILYIYIYIYIYIKGYTNEYS